MDELTRVRELRADAQAPDRARLAPGRARLLDAARADERHRALWRRREFVIVGGVVAAVTAVAVTVSLLLGGGGGDRKVQPATTPGVHLKGVSASELLRGMAEEVAKQPDGPVPTAKQWIYTKVVQEPVKDPKADQYKNLPKGALKLMTGPQESWLRYDGTAQAGWNLDTTGEKLELQVSGMQLENGAEGDDRSPREMYQTLAALPSTAEGTLKALREQNAIADGKGESQSSDDYTEITVLLRADVMPSKALASLYRALATVPGGKVVDHLVDTGAGRRAIALTYGRPGAGQDMREEWLIDPQTYRVFGMRLLQGDRIATGSVTVSTAVVNAPGDRA
ncbi:CU044_5270 family protein [Streptomyces cylindrosporus]|uniref:CU044_5270 family protein n=1 Tax=Streptomyces cylindrosporus TaxID=2927583 RepID=A0ABS9YKW0_9ACTN|nr:CU044_5270 family protein [Streptomyces cylindrosporus]MCI3277196.1 CU044_5270 family protein [Streptomyces cylindrosporus]